MSASQIAVSVRNSAAVSHSARAPLAASLMADVGVGVVVASALIRAAVVCEDGRCVVAMLTLLEELIPCARKRTPQTNTQTDETTITNAPTFSPSPHGRGGQGVRS